MHGQMACVRALSLLLLMVGSATIQGMQDTPHQGSQDRDSLRSHDYSASHDDANSLHQHSTQRPQWARKLAQFNSVCSATATSAFSTSGSSMDVNAVDVTNTPSLRVCEGWFKSNKHVQSNCAQWANLNLVIEDLVMNQVTAETVRVKYGYRGTFVQANGYACSALPSINSETCIGKGKEGTDAPDIILMTSDLYKYLSNTLDKPYPPNIGLSPSQVCTSAPCSSSTPWYLISTTPINITYDVPPKCCGVGNTTCSMSSFKSEIFVHITANNTESPATVTSAPRPPSPSFFDNFVDYPPPDYPSPPFDFQDPDSPDYAPPSPFVSFDSSPSPSPIRWAPSPSPPGSNPSTIGSSPSPSGSSSSSSGSSSSGSKTIGIAAGVAGGIGALVAIVLGVWCYKRRRSNPTPLVANVAPPKLPSVAPPSGWSGSQLSTTTCPSSTATSVAIVQLTRPVTGDTTQSNKTQTNTIQDEAYTSASPHNTRSVSVPIGPLSAYHTRNTTTTTTLTTSNSTSTSTLQSLPEGAASNLTSSMVAPGQDTLTQLTGNSSNSSNGSNSSYSNMYGEVVGGISSRPVSVSGMSVPSVVLADHMKISYGQLEKGDEIGRGGFSIVYSCVWEGRCVVLKEVRPELANQRQRISLIKEALLMRELQHPAVARVYGVMDEPPHIALVMQWYKRGTLEDYMCNPSTSHEYQNLSDMDRLRLAGQVADGMAFLHARNPPIVHGDLKAANVLVDEDDCVVITDFGLAVQLLQNGGSGPTPASPAGGDFLSMFRGNSGSLFSKMWTSPTSALSVFISPPEVLKNPQAPRQPSSDVYAFGVTLLQIMTGRVPYRGMSHDMVINAVCRGQRPLLSPDEIPEPVAALIADCWAQDLKARPSAADVAVRIRTMLRTNKA